jgi:hypothetical protein
MRASLHWYELSAGRRERECQLLGSLPYFALERTSTNAARKFTALGTLHFVGHRTGRKQVLRVRLEYPAEFPKKVPRVYDHDGQFATCLEGHLFSDHELCLTLPERGEFRLGTEELTAEVLGATLIWFQKRLLFDRTKRWPGPAEPHGINAVLNLLVERFVAPDASTISAWLLAHASTHAGNPGEPDLYATCPCGSGKKLKFCHRDELNLVFKRIARFPPTFQLAEVLKLK